MRKHLKTNRKLFQKTIMRGSVSEGPIALVLAPTRELVQQIHSVAQKLTSSQNRRGSGGFGVFAVYGGQRRMEQLQQMKQQRALHLLVATVGRLLDFMHPRRVKKRGWVLHGFTWFCGTAWLGGEGVESKSFGICGLDCDVRPGDTRAFQLSKCSFLVLVAQQHVQPACGALNWNH